MRKKTSKIFLGIWIFFLFSLSCFGKTYEIYLTENTHNHLQLNTATGEIKQIQDDGQKWIICNGIDKLGKKEGRFALYPTKNNWNFLLLDTYTGKVWQSQFSTKGEEYRMTFPINFLELSTPSKNSNWKNRFELYQTSNMWNFILLDSYTGRTWQLQYSVEESSNTGIFPIYDESLINSSKKLVRRFKLYETKNMWNFILLDSCTGRLWQLQYTVDKDSFRGIISINEEELAKEERKEIFYIMPLTSMYQYYLVNGNSGQMWKFQWSTKGEDYRWIEEF